MDTKDPPEQQTAASKDEPVQFDPSRSGMAASAAEEENVPNQSSKDSHRILKISSQDSSMTTTHFEDSLAYACSFYFEVIGTIKRKALIKELAAAYHSECLSYCQELLQLQRKWEQQQYIERKAAEDARKQMVTKPSKRPKKRL